MNYWKWSNGETYYQSARKYPVKETATNKINFDSKMNAIEQSLAEDILPNHNVDNFDTFDSFGVESSSSSKRESLDNKMADRELVSQRGANPFSAQTSYVNDVVTRDMFLKPINTTQGRTKNQNKGENE
jgi:hypothetical protein